MPFPRSARRRTEGQIGPVTPRRPRNADLRYLTPREVDRLQDAARKHSRYGHRDATAILIAYRHGLGASELCELTWKSVPPPRARGGLPRAWTTAKPPFPTLRWLTGGRISN